MLFCLGESLLILKLVRVRILECHMRDKSACYLPTSSNDESNLGLSFDEEVSGLLGSALGINEGLVGGGILSSVLLSIGSSGGSLGGAILLGCLTVSLELSEALGITCALLCDIFGDGSCPKTNTKVMLVSTQRLPQMREAAVRTRETTNLLPSSRPLLISEQRSHRLGEAAIRTFVTIPLFNK